MRTRKTAGSSACKDIRSMLDSGKSGIALISPDTISKEPSSRTCRNTPKEVPQITSFSEIYASPSLIHMSERVNELSQSFELPR